MITSILVFYLLIVPAYTTSSLFMTSAFHVVRPMTTSGFQFADILSLSAEGKIILITLMLIWGMAFSTAGGIKAGMILQTGQ